MKHFTLKKIISLLLVGALCLSCSACSMGETSIDELMRPPQLSQSRQQVQSAVNKLLGGGYQLISPAGGKHRSSINLADLNQDEQNEAICFFMNAQTKLIEILVLRKGESDWEEQGRFASDATAVDKLEIADLDQDGISELIVGWSYLTGTDRSLEILRAENDRLSSEYHGRCSQFEVIQAKSSFVVSIDLAEDAATLLGYRGHKFSSLSTVPVDPRISTFTAVTVSETTEHKPAVYLDAQLEDQSYHTEILVINQSEHLENKLLTGEGSGADRPINIRCSDIDGDGIPEVPRCAAMEQGEGASYYTFWSKYDGAQLLEPLTTFTAPIDGFYFAYPEHWIDAVFVRQDKEVQRLYHFVNRREQTLYSLRTFTPGEFAQVHPAEGWISIAQTADKVIACKQGEYHAQRPFSTEDWANAIHTY